MKFTGKIWNKQKRQNEVVEFEITQATLDDVRTRMSQTNPTESQIIDAFISEITRSMGGRTINQVKRIS